MEHAKATAGVCRGRHVQSSQLARPRCVRTATRLSVLEYGERSSLRGGLVVWGIPELRVRLGPIDDLAREAALGHERVESHGHVVEEPAARGVLPRHPHLVPVGAEGEVGTLRAKGEMVRKAHVWAPSAFERGSNAVCMHPCLAVVRGRRLGWQSQGNWEERRRTAMECWFFRYSLML